MQYILILRDDYWARLGQKCARSFWLDFLPTYMHSGKKGFKKVLLMARIMGHDLCNCKFVHILQAKILFSVAFKKKGSTQFYVLA